MDSDFLVVGGGIGGTVLAELLGRGGKKVVVLERNTAPPKWVRPEILWPATAEVLFSLIPKETWELNAVLPLQGVQIKAGQQTAVILSPERLRTFHIQPWSTDPNQTREELLQLGAFEVRRGVEVVTVLKEKNRIVGVRTRDVATAEEREVTAQYTIGDDGVHSLVRAACGIPITTRLFPVDFLCFGFDWPATLAAATSRGWLNTNRFNAGIFVLAAVPLPNGKGAGLIAVQSKIFDASADHVEEAWSRFCSADAVIHDVIRERRFPNDFTRIKRPWGHAARYGAEGAILMGDAAHPVSPAGGQGANMSVADACVLAETILSNRPQLLEEYERRRRPANQRSLGFTRAAAWVLGLPEWCFSPSLFFLILKWVARHPSLVHRGIRTAATAFQEQRK